MTLHPEFFDIRGLIQVRGEIVREARALPPGPERNQKRQIARSLKSLIEGQIQARNDTHWRASAGHRSLERIASGPFVRDERLSAS